MRSIYQLRGYNICIDKDNIVQLAGSTLLWELQLCLKENSDHQSTVDAGEIEIADQNCKLRVAPRYGNIYPGRSCGSAYQIGASKGRCSHNG